MTVDEFVIEIQAKTDGLAQGLKNALNAVLDFGEKVRNVLGGIVGGLATAWVSAFVNAFKEMKQEASAIGQLSKDVNASVEDLSAWSNAIESSGGSAKSFQGAISNLSKDLSGFSITGKSAKKPLFEALGLDMESLSSKPILDVVSDIATSIEGMDKNQSKNILKRLGFDSETIEIIQSGRKNIDDLIAKQKEWGVYTKKDTDALEKMDKSMKEMSIALKTTFIPLFSKIIGVMARFTSYFAKAARWLRDNLDVVRKAVILLAVAFSSKLLKAFQQLALAMKTNKFLLLITVITMLLLVLEDLWVYANNGESAFEGLWEKLGTPEEVMSGFERFGKAILSILDFVDSAEAKFLFLFGILTKGILVIGALFGGIPVAVAAAVAGAIAFIYTYWDELKTTAQTFVNMFVDFFRIGGVLHSALSEFSKALLDFFTNPIDKIKKAWIEFKEWFIKNLGSLSAITSRMTTNGMSAQMALEGGGTGDTIYNYDNSSNKLYFTTGEASSRAIKEMGYADQANRGSR